MTRSRPGMRPYRARDGSACVYNMSHEPRCDAMMIHSTTLFRTEYVVMEVLLCDSVSLDMHVPKNPGRVARMCKDSDSVAKG